MKRDGFEPADLSTLSAQRGRAIAVLALLLFPLGAAAQDGATAGGGQAGFISTVAGTGEFVPGDGGPALGAGLESPRGAAEDSAGNLYIADPASHRVRKVDRAGRITTVAGNGVRGFSGDGGPATAAQLASPYDVAVDAAGNLWIADEGNSRVRRVDLAGTISTVAGDGTPGSTGDGGLATAAQLRPRSVTLDSDGNLYVADYFDHRVRRVDLAGTISTVAGDGTAGYSGDGGPATSAQLAFPSGLAVDRDGNLFIADVSNHRVRRVDLAGTITTVAGNGSRGYSGDGGPATSARLALPSGLAVDRDGNLFIADVSNHRVRRVSLAGTITTVAGNGTEGHSGDGGLATSAELASPRAIALNSDGLLSSISVSVLHIVDTGNQRVRRLDRGGRIATVVGNGSGRYGGDGGPAPLARFQTPADVLPDASGNLYIADVFNHRVRRIDTAGTITTIAGNGSRGFSGDGGPATAARLSVPSGLAMDASGNLYIAEVGNHRVRKIDPDGTITTVAGDGTAGYSGDGGPAAAGRLASPYDVAVDPDGNLYIADLSNHRVRRVTPDGTITTVAGNGSRGFSGDGGSAVDGQIALPRRIAVDAAGNLYVVDYGNHRVRRVDTVGVISTVAGTGTRGFSGDGGSAADAQLSGPDGVAVDAAGNLYISDRGNHRIRRVDSAGTITTIAGHGAPGFAGDGGPAIDAQLSFPRGVAVDRDGNLLIADTGNHRIRRVPALGAESGATPVLPGDPPPGTVRDQIAPGVFADFELVPAEQPFYMGRYEVTRDQWQAVIGSDPSGSRGCTSGDCPVESVSWLDVQDFLIKLNDLAGENGLYRLPTEAEWQFAARGGQAGPVQGTDASAWCKGTSGGATHPVGEKEPNGYGLHDMVGNVAEWTATAQGALRVYRGSDWGGEEGGDCVSSSSAQARPVDRSILIGFRIVRVVGGVAVPVATPTMTTVVGTGTRGFSGDGGPATRARIWVPSGLAVDAAGNLYVADRSNHRVRKVDASGVITTVAGSGTEGYGGDGGRATQAHLAYPQHVAVDGAGSLYIADYANHRIRRVDPDGTITTVAGTGEGGYGGDGGPAVSAQLLFPAGVAVDAAGNLFIGDAGNHRVRKIDPSGVITTLAGTGEWGHGGDGGPALNALLAGPSQLTVDGAGNLYIADRSNHRVRRVDPSGTITTVAGSGPPGLRGGYGGDGGPATGALLDQPLGVAVDRAGNLYIADHRNSRVRLVDAAGTITTLAGGGTGSEGGHPSDVQLSPVNGVAVDAAGNVYFSEWNDRVWKVTFQGGVVSPRPPLDDHANDASGATRLPLNSSLAGMIETAGDEDWFRLETSERRHLKVRTMGNLDTVGTLIDAAGRQLAADDDSGSGTNFFLEASAPAGVYFVRVRAYSDSATGSYTIEEHGEATAVTPPSAQPGTITTVAGTGEYGYSGDDGPATAARLGTPVGLVVDAAGNLYISDHNARGEPYNFRVRKVDRSGTITTVAGTGAEGYSGDGGPATAARLHRTAGLAVDAVGNLYIADLHNYRVRKVDAAGTITTVAGTGEYGYGGDGGPATAARLRWPTGVAVDATGNLYVADQDDHRVRKVDAAGTITTVAGTGEYGYGGDGGPATAARLGRPNGVALDAVGNLYIADRSNHRVRRVDAAGTITTVAGTGAEGYSGDGGPATDARLGYPYSVTVDATGNLYVGDTVNDRVRKVDAAGTITTVAGTGERGYSGDGGPATDARLNLPFGVAVDAAGNLYVGEWGSHRVRKVTFAASEDPVPFRPEPVEVPLGRSGEVVVLMTTEAGGFTLEGRSFASGSSIIAANGNEYLLTLAGGIWKATYLVVIVEVMLGTFGGTVTLEWAEDGSWWLDGQEEVVSGQTVEVPNGNLYRLMLDEAGGWYAEYVPPAPVTVPLGTSGDVVTLVRAEDGTWRFEGQVVISGETTVAAANGTQYRLSQGEDGSWTATPVRVTPAGDDHANDAAGATRLALNSSLNGAIETSGDEDWFRLETSGRRHLKVRTTGSLDTVGTLFDSSDQQLATNDDGGSGTNFALEAEVEAGVYFVRVRAFSSSETGRYTIEEHGEAAVVAPSSEQPGTIVTVAGTGVEGYSGDGGPATSALLNRPLEVAVDADGSLYFADSGNHRVRKVDPSGEITTVAGAGSTGYGGDGGPALDARLNWPRGLAVDGAGNLYIVDSQNHRLRRVDRSGVITTVAGTGSPRYFGDGGPAIAAGLSDSYGVAVDAAGNLYIGDNDGRVRRVGLDGTITTVAGTGAGGYGGDGGPATAAQLRNPRGLAVDRAGNLYIADSGNFRLRRVGLDGTITTVAGTGTNVFSGDGSPAATTQIGSPWGVAVDAAGNLFITTNSFRVLRVGLDGLITTVAGTGVAGYSGDGGPATAAQLSQLYGIAVDAAGNLFLAATGDHRVRKVTFAASEDPVPFRPEPVEVPLGRSGEVVVLMTTEAGGFTLEGRSFASGSSITAANGNTYVLSLADDGVWTVTYVATLVEVMLGTTGGTVTLVLAEDGSWWIGNDLVVSGMTRTRGSGDTEFVLSLTDDGIWTASPVRILSPADDHANDSSGATRLALNSSLGGVIETAGDEDWFRLETTVPRDLKIRTTGSLDTVGTLFDASQRQLAADDDSGSGNNFFLEASVPAGVYFVRVRAYSGSQTGSYTVEEHGEAARSPTPSTELGTITTVAGSASGGPSRVSYNGEPALSANLWQMRGVAVDAARNLYIADTYVDLVHRVDAAGAITTVAGTGTAGHGGDGGPATSAQLYGPAGMALDAAGNLYIADSHNHRVRKVDAAGTITTVAGTGEIGYGGDGSPATLAQLSFPWDVAVDRAGSLYIADRDNHRVRKVDATGTITTVAGTGEPGYGGDGGPATSAQFYGPAGIALDAAGNLYMADRINHRVRRVDSSGTITTVAGSGPTGRDDGAYGGDGGPATAARLNSPAHLAVDADGTLYIADSWNRRVRSVNIAGSAPTFQPQPVTVALGSSGDFVTLMTARDGGYTLEGRSFASGSIIIAVNGNEYVLTLADGIWEATYLVATVMVQLGTFGGTVTLERAEDGTWWLDGQEEVISGQTVEEPNGNLYRLMLDEAGTWYAEYVPPAPATVPLGTSGDVVTLVRAEDGTWRFEGQVVISGETTVAAANGTQYRLSQGEDGSWTATPVRVTPAGDDHANDAAGATRLALNSSLNGAIETSGDEDWFGLETSGRRHLKVRTTGSLDTVGTLFDASNQQLAWNDDGGSGTNFSLEAEVPAGVYYVRVRAFSASATGSYRVEEHGEAVAMTPPSEQGTTITTVAGTGARGYGGDGGLATSANLDNPKSVASDATGNLYIADNNNHRVRKVDRAGRITTVAGTGRLGFSGDGGAATDAEIRDPVGVAVDRAGNLYIAGHGRVRRVDPQGTITTVAGSGTCCTLGDGGPAVDAWMRPYGVTVDSAGNLYIAERDDHRVRKVDPAGIVTTVAGTGVQGSGGDGGSATSAQLNLPVEVAVDAAGNVYIADQNNYRVRKVDRAGGITTVAGSGNSGYGGDGGQATSARMGQVTGVAVDSVGNLYIAHLGQSSIRKVDVSGRISTVAGGSDQATRRELGFVSGLAVDSDGSLYTGETNGSRVRKVVPAGASGGTVPP